MRNDGRKAVGKKLSEGGGEGKANPIAVERYLKGVDYPTSKKELIKQAKQNKAPSDVMHVLDQLGEKKYSSPIDISKEVKKIG